MLHEAQGLQERAARFGCETLADHESLTLILSRRYSACASDRADALLRRFQSLPGVLGATLQELQDVVDASAALDLKIINDATRRALEAPVRDRCVLSSWTALLAYVKATMEHRTRECFRVMFLDKRNALIADEVMNEGTVDHAPVYPREVMRRALELGASALILVHNHPSGDPTPSGADVEMTRQLVDAARTLKIVIHDHLIAGNAGVSSLKALGLF